jgi:hypothetical protein
MESLGFIIAIILFIVTVIVIIIEMFTNKTMKKWLLKLIPSTMKFILNEEGINISKEDLVTLESYISDGVLTSIEKDDFLKIISKYLSHDKYVSRKEEILSMLDGTLSLISSTKIDEETKNYLKTLVISFLNIVFKRLK